MNYADEEYVRLYVRDTVTWKLLGWEGRTVLLHMLRGKFDRSGVFDVSQPVTDRHAVSRAVQAVTDLPQVVVEPGLEQLLSEGVWTECDSGLVWPNYVEAQTCARTNKARKKLERSNRAAEKASKSRAEIQSQTVTLCHGESQPVTTRPPEQKQRQKQKQKDQLTLSSPEAHDGDDSAKEALAAEASRVFEAWRELTGHSKAKFDQKRKARIQARIRDGFTSDQLIQAISNRIHDKWLMGENPGGKVFDGIETLLRDCAQVERLMELGGEVVECEY